MAGVAGVLLSRRQEEKLGVGGAGGLPVTGEQPKHCIETRRREQQERHDEDDDDDDDDDDNQSAMMLDHRRRVEVGRGEASQQESKQTSPAGVLQQGKELGNQDGNHSRKLEPKNLRANTDVSDLADPLMTYLRQRWMRCAMHTASVDAVEEKQTLLPAVVHRAADNPPHHRRLFITRRPVRQRRVFCLDWLP
ncbi:hypothetical protein BKA80DRAFT_257277 [Phyllosticta citrichinensis]